jgi:hypothetical protein
VRIKIIRITSTKRKEQNFNRNDKTELKAKKIVDSKNQFYYILNLHDFFFSLALCKRKMSHLICFMGRRKHLKNL